jgi:hypothetical protein
MVTTYVPGLPLSVNMGRIVRESSTDPVVTNGSE